MKKISFKTKIIKILQLVTKQIFRIHLFYKQKPDYSQLLVSN
jgi:hypothetical protein